MLVIDDEISVGELIRRVLTDEGHECTLARSTNEADRVLAEGTIDAQTLDLTMPGGGGLEWLEALAARDPALAARTLIVTGDAVDFEVLGRIRRCGAGYLAKPFSLEALVAAFRRHSEPEGQAID